MTKCVLDIPVEFGGVSIGKETAKLGMKIKKPLLNIVAAEEVFCGRRLEGTIKLGGGDDCPGQTKMFETDIAVDGVFDIHRFGVGPDAYTTGATFKLNEIDIGELAQFSKGAGRLVVVSNNEIPHDEVDDDEDGDSETLPGTFAQDQPWREVSLDLLFSGGVLKSLKGAGLNSVGDLYEYQQPKKNGFVNQLADIKGLGTAKVQQVEDRMMEFWRDNPQE